MSEIFNCVGIANILQKKKLTIDGKEKNYFMNLGPTFGGWADFSEGRRFLIFYGKQAGTLANYDGSDYYIADFSSLQTLSNDNDHRYEPSTFFKLDKYAYNKGQYYTLNESDNTYYLVKDPILERKIHRAWNGYTDRPDIHGMDINQLNDSIKSAIIGQDDQVKQILLSLFKNHNVAHSKTSNGVIARAKDSLIIIGADNTGKKSTIKQIANRFEVPFVFEDSTDLSTGDKTIEKMLEELYLASGKDMESAEVGILVLDHFEELAMKSQSDKNNRAQRSLTDLLHGKTYYFNGIKFNTSKLSIVAVGSFPDLAKQKEYAQISKEDIQKYGMQTELMNSFSKLIAMNPLTKEDFRNILTHSILSPLNVYRLYFKSNGISITYDDSLIEYIMEEAETYGYQIECLKIIVDKVMNDIMEMVYSNDYSSITLYRPDSDGVPYEFKK